VGSALAMDLSRLTDFCHRLTTSFQSSWDDADWTRLAALMAWAIARERGEDGVITIQGALIRSQGLNDPAPFQRVVKQLPQMLRRDLPKQKIRAKKMG
jgi:TetR/AcrR family transcriptional regulator, lmrAB and yxaGH operons repressor